MHRGKTSPGMLERLRRVCPVRPVLPSRSAFAGFRFPRKVIVLAVRCTYATTSPTAMLKSYWRNTVCTLTTQHPSMGPAVHPAPGRGHPPEDGDVVNLDASLGP
jgi:hypothetical protein